MSNVKVVMFKCGHEVIGTVKSTNKSDALVIESPAALMRVPKAGPTGQPEGWSIALSPFLPYTNDKSMEFPWDDVFVMVEPTEDLYNYYNQAFGTGLMVPDKKIKLV